LGRALGGFGVVDWLFVRGHGEACSKNELNILVEWSREDLLDGIVLFGVG
jgi:hypothetical protein